MPQGLTDWKTTIPALVSAIFGFVLFKPEYFPPFIQDVAAYIFAGGLAALGINSASSKKEK